MPPNAVVVALIAALVGVIAGIVYWSGIRKHSVRSKERDRAWDRHARNRSSENSIDLSLMGADASPSRSKSDVSPEGAKASSERSAAPAKSSSPPPEASSSKASGDSKSARGAKADGEPKPAQDAKAGRSPKSSRDPKSTRSPKSSGESAPLSAGRSGAPGKKSSSAPPSDGTRRAGKSASARKQSEQEQFPWRDDYPSLLDESEDEDTDLTIVTLGPFKAPPKLAEILPDTLYDDDDDDSELRAQRSSAVPIVYDEDAAVDEPTGIETLILVSAVGQTDRGQRRRKNEDSYAVLTEQGVFVVADGMGGHSGGEIASKIAVDVMTEAFLLNNFNGERYPDVPRRGSELASAIQMANLAIYEHSRTDAHLAGMGTTVVSARFAPNKQRVYIGHVGDSRCYRLRDEELRQITTDHTMGAVGLTGPLADRLERAVGIAPAVKVDVILARPLPEDLYLLCSDGLSKMLPSDEIRQILLAEKKIEAAAAKLIDRANASGGKDNITVILVKITSPGDISKVLPA